MRFLSASWLASVFLALSLPLHAQDEELSVNLSAEPTESGGVLIKGKLSGRVPMPGINDFRLKRLGDEEDTQFVPLLFGNERSMT